MLSRKNSHTPRTGTTSNLFFSQVFCFVFFLLTSCSVLFPDRTAPKSSIYTTSPPGNPWEAVPVGADAESTDALKADLAYEHPTTGAIISLNSICRKYTDLSLKNLTMNLVRGIESLQIISQKNTTVAGVPALDTNFSGSINDTDLHIRTIVLIKKYCTYDFLYVAVPEKELDSETTFDKFVVSFAVKDE